MNDSRLQDHGCLESTSPRCSSPWSFALAGPRQGHQDPVRCMQAAGQAYRRSVTTAVCGMMWLDVVSEALGGLDINHRGQGWLHWAGGVRMTNVGNLTWSLTVLGNLHLARDGGGQACISNVSFYLICLPNPSRDSAAPQLSAETGRDLSKQRK